MSFVRDFRGEGMGKAHRKNDMDMFQVYPFERAGKEQVKNAMYFKELANHQSINPGGRSSLKPATIDQAFFYPVVYEQN